MNTQTDPAKPKKMMNANAPSFFINKMHQKKEAITQNTSKIEEESKKEQILPNLLQPTEPIFDFLLALHIEAQCEKNNMLDLQEIIEISIVPINIKTGKIEENCIFHSFVKPRLHKKLTAYCKEVTEIAQYQVDSASELEEVLKNIDVYLKHQKIYEKEFCFLTCGEWGLMSCLKKESKVKRINLPEYLQKFIDIKECYQKTMKSCPPKFRIGDMLQGLHCTKRNETDGISDSMEIAEIALKLMEKQFLFTKNMVKTVKL